MVFAASGRSHPACHLYFTSLSFASLHFKPCVSPAGLPHFFIATSWPAFSCGLRFFLLTIHAAFALQVCSFKTAAKRKRPCLAYYGLVPSCFAFPAQAFGWHGAGWRSGLTLLLLVTKTTTHQAVQPQPQSRSTLPPVRRPGTAPFYILNGLWQL